MDISKLEVHEMPVDDAILHRVVEYNPMMEETQYNALRDDIEEKGQLVPVLVYRKKIVDGRHRLLALKELGEPTIKYVNLPSNYSISTVQGVVKSMETRRHQDKTSQAIQGYRLWKKEGYNRIEAANYVGVTQSLLSDCNYIAKHEGEVVLESLWEGNYYIKSDKTKTRSLPAIRNDIKQKKPKTEFSATEDVDTNPLFKSAIQIYENATPELQDAIYAAIRAKRTV